MDKFDFLPKVHFTSFYEQQSGITKTESPEPGNLFLPYWAPSGDDEIWSGQPCRLDFGDLRRFHLWSSEIQNPKCKLFDYWEIWYYPFFFYFKWFLEQQTVGLQQEELYQIALTRRMREISSWASWGKLWSIFCFFSSWRELCSEKLSDEFTFISKI